MKKILVGIVLLNLFSLSCMAQEQEVSLTAKKDSLGMSRRMHENKAIGLSGLTGDTLSWSQFTNSDAVTVKNKKSGEEITMYRLSIFYPNDDLQEYVQLNDFLSDYIIREIIATGVKKIMISDVTLTRGKEDRNVGYRWFYFK